MLRPCLPRILHEGRAAEAERSPFRKDVARNVSTRKNEEQLYREGTHATPIWRGTSGVRGCMRLGPRFRTSKSRTRSNRFTGAYIPLVRKTSACESWS